MTAALYLAALILLLALVRGGTRVEPLKPLLRVSVISVVMFLV